MVQCVAVVSDQVCRAFIHACVLQGVVHPYLPSVCATESFVQQSSPAVHVVVLGIDFVLVVVGREFIPGQ
jgi:hypothetical protein